MINIGEKIEIVFNSRVTLSIDKEAKVKGWLLWESVEVITYRVIMQRIMDNNV